jgi:tetratricopeptide (TPR) repeat protein
MKYHPPRRAQISERDFRVFNHCLEAGYIVQDAMLGVLVDLATADATVMVMSDHGFHPDHLRPRVVPQEAAGPAVEHRQLGIFAAKGPKIKADGRIYGASILDITPTILHHFGLPVGEDMDGKVLLDLFVAPGEIARIPSWDAVPGEDGRHPADRVIAPADSKAALDQLVALGYITKPDEDERKALEHTMRELDYNLSQAYLDGGIYSEAMILLERLHHQWPEEHRFGLTLANCYHALGRIAELRELVGKIIERRLVEARTAVAEINVLNLEDAATQEAERARLEKMTEEEKEKFVRERRALLARARPNLLALEALEARADFAEKKYPEALGKLAQLQKDYGARRNALTLRGEIHLRMRDWEEARIAFGEVLEIDPEAPGAHLGMARAALAEGAFEEAAKHALTSIGLLFHQPRAHYLLGLAQYRAGDWENAERAFLIAVQQAPLLAAAYRMLSEVARHFKKDLGAALQYRTYARLALQRRVDLSHARIGEARRSQEILRPAHETMPMPVLLPRKGVLKGVPQTEIITVVTGLPRSGTSLMMQMLRAGGMEIFTDGSRGADEANPQGYFEHERVAGLLREDDPSWMMEARGKAVKIVAPLLSSLPFRMVNGTGRQPYRVIFMERAMEEILQSQATMMARLGRAPSSSGDIGKAYRQQLHGARAFLTQLGIPALEVQYARLIAEPEGGAMEVARFLGREASAQAMAKCVRPELYRARGAS